MRPAAPIALLLAGAGLALAGCPRRGRDEAPAPRVALGPHAAWTQVRAGDAPALRPAAGGPWLFFFPDRVDGPSHTFPGLTPGTARGPSFALLDGAFAPLLAVPTPDCDHRLTITATGATLWARFEPASREPGGASAGEPEGASAGEPGGGSSGDRVTAAVRVVGARTEVVWTGPATILLPADRARVRATLEGRPATAFEIASSRTADMRRAHADALEVQTAKGLITARSSCAHPAIIRPILRGSTSAFVVRLGPLPDAGSAFSSGAPQGGDTCGAAVTSTVTF